MEESGFKVFILKQHEYRTAYALLVSLYYLWLVFQYTFSFLILNKNLPVLGRSEYGSE